MPQREEVMKKWRSEDVKVDENITFHSLMLSECVANGLALSGFVHPSPIQYKAIPIGRCGVDMIIQSKSGTGKTCVLGVIILERLIDIPHLQALVLSPTREIAHQTCGVINSLGQDILYLQCSTFIGGTPIGDDKIKAHTCQVAVGTPGRIKHLMEMKDLQPGCVRILVLDEADKLIEHSFSDDVNWIFSHLPERKQVLALSATYPPDLKNLIKNYMRSPSIISANENEMALKGIVQFFCAVDYHPMSHIVYRNKKNILRKILTTVNFSQCVIFCNYVSRVESICSWLKEKGYPVAKISSNDDQIERLNTMDKLKAFKCRILVSSNLTSRGIDAENVDLVINFDLAECLETYLHRIGRGGRFGSKAVSITLVTKGHEQQKLGSFEQEGNFKVFNLPYPLPDELITFTDEKLESYGIKRCVHFLEHLENIMINNDQIQSKMGKEILTDMKSGESNGTHLRNELDHENGANEATVRCSSPGKSDEEVVSSPEHESYRQDQRSENLTNGNEKTSDKSLSIIRDIVNQICADQSTDLCSTTCNIQFVTTDGIEAVSGRKDDLSNGIETESGKKDNLSNSIETESEKKDDLSNDNQLLNEMPASFVSNDINHNKLLNNDVKDSALEKPQCAEPLSHSADDIFSAKSENTDFEQINQKDHSYSQGKHSQILEKTENCDSFSSFDPKCLVQKIVDSCGENLSEFLLPHHISNHDCKGSSLIDKEKVLEWLTPCFEKCKSDQIAIETEVIGKDFCEDEGTLCNKVAFNTLNESNLSMLETYVQEHRKHFFDQLSQTVKSNLGAVSLKDSPEIDEPDSGKPETVSTVTKSPISSSKVTKESVLQENPIQAHSITVDTASNKNERMEDKILESPRITEGAKTDPALAKPETVHECARSYSSQPRNAEIPLAFQLNHMPKSYSSKPKSALNKNAPRVNESFRSKAYKSELSKTNVILDAEASIPSFSDDDDDCQISKAPEKRFINKTNIESVASDMSNLANHSLTKKGNHLRPSKAERPFKLFPQKSEISMRGEIARSDHVIHDVLVDRKAKPSGKKSSDKSHCRQAERRHGDSAGLSRPNRRSCHSSSVKENKHSKIKGPVLHNYPSAVPWRWPPSFNNPECIRNFSTTCFECGSCVDQRACHTAAFCCSCFQHLSRNRPGFDSCSSLTHNFMPKPHHHELGQALYEQFMHSLAILKHKKHMH